MSGEVIEMEKGKDGVYAMSQRRHKKKIEARRRKHSGKGRTDGPRKRKGVPAPTVGKRLRVKHRARLLDAPEPTHDLIFGVDKKAGKPVLYFRERPKPDAKEAA